jgi:MFS family permease
MRDPSLQTLVTVLSAVALVFSTNPLLTSSSVQVAKQLGLKDDEEAKKYISGLLTLVYYLSGALVAPVVGYLLGFHRPKHVLAMLVSLSAVSCNLTAFVTTTESERGLGELMCTRAIGGAALGGMLPVVYVMVRS